MAPKTPVPPPPRQQPAGTVAIEVRFEGGDDIPILFANHIFIRSGPDGFMLSFAQSHGPYLLRPTAKQLRSVGVGAKVIARLLVPPHRMQEMVDLLAATLKDSQTKREEPHDGNSA